MAFLKTQGMPPTEHPDSKETSGIAIISAKTAYLAGFQAVGNSLPILHAIDLEAGHSADLTDSLEQVLSDEQLTAVHLYIETLQKVPELSQAALKAVRKGIPIVVVKGGQSAAGQRVMPHHPDRLANENVVISALFDRLGFIECATLAEALETLKMLMYGGRPLGRKIALVSNSSTYATLSADTATAVGLDICQLEDSISAYLKPLVTKHLPSNPLALNSEDQTDTSARQQIFKSFLMNEFDVAVQVVPLSTTGESAAEDSTIEIEMVEAFAKESALHRMPCVHINPLPQTLETALSDKIIANGVAPLQGLQHGFKAVINSARFVEQMVLMAQMPTGAIVLPKTPNLTLTQQLDEVESKRRLYKSGITVPKAAVIEGSQSLDLAGMKFPIVLKAVSADLTHKTELDAVRLNIQSEDQLRQTLFDIHKWLDSVNLRGFLIEEMVTDGVGELLVGIRQVTGIGQVLTLAFGGTTVELLGDAKTLILPASSAEIELALRSLRLFPTINGWRGQPAADTNQVVEAIALICNYAQSEQDQLYALEINPLIVRPAEYSPVAADVVIQLGEEILP
ncbi:MAG: acetate--CoA ligase family protein [Anaerolineae bacterium]